MKKKLFFLASAAIALASCSTDEVMNLNPESALTFRAAVDHSSSSRSTDTETTNLNKFLVTAFENTTPGQEWPVWKTIFTNLEFTRIGDTNNYVSNPVYQWSHDMELNIYAYSYYTSDNFNPEEPIAGAEVTIDPDQQTINNFTPQPDIKNQIDLVVATAMNQKVTLDNPGSPIPLHFNHILTSFQVVAKCTSKTHRVMVKGMKYGNISAKGDFGFDYYISGTQKPWTIDDSQKASYEVLYFNEPITLNDETGYDHIHSEGAVANYYDISKSEKGNGYGYAIVLPQTLTTFSKDNQYWEKGSDDLTPGGKTQTSAQYIAVLVKIDALDENGNVTAPKFPITPGHMVPGTDGYGWAYIPMHYDDQNPSHSLTETLMGKRYIFHLDFTDGAGYNEDGDDILEGTIDFTASVGEWSAHDVTAPTDVFPEENPTPNPAE